MIRGTVKAWVNLKGFGFFKPDDGGGDIFCHISEVSEAHDYLVPGQNC
jgi:cold shock CspA family protein